MRKGRPSRADPFTSGASRSLDVAEDGEEEEGEEGEEDE
jgi:hypothetical protein